jgi:hypothetical protein
MKDGAKYIIIKFWLHLSQSGNIGLFILHEVTKGLLVRVFAPLFLKVDSKSG